MPVQDLKASKIAELLEGWMKDVRPKRIGGEETILHQTDETLAIYQDQVRSLKALMAVVLMEVERLETKIRNLRQSRNHLLDSINTEKSVDKPARKSESALVRSLAREILLGAGHPLSRAELVKKMSDRGVKFSFANPPKAISKILWAAKEFDYVNYGYWVAGAPLEGKTVRKTRYRSKKKE